ncbi:MAG: hypothetical protein L3J75_09755 [Methylococcaceae bacterium]|nr:hypothetical protein [Methylococcaceae bacterium]
MKNINNENFARTLADILYSQKQAAQIAFVIVFFSCVAYVVLAPDNYQADGSLLFQVKENRTDLKASDDEIIKTSIIKIDGLSSESERLTSRRVLLKTAQKLIVQNPAYHDEESLPDSILNALIIDVDTDSNIISLSLSWDNAEDAKFILDTLMQIYLESRKQGEGLIMKNASLDNSLSSYLDGWKKKKAEVLALIKKHNAPDIDHELLNNLALKKHFQTQIAVSEKEKISLKEDIKILNSMFNDGEMHLYSFLSNEVLNGLIESLKSIKKEKLEADKIFLPNRIEVKELDQLFKTSYKELKEKIRLHLEKQKSVLKGTEQNIADMKKSIKNLDKRNIELKEIAIKMEQLTMEASLLASSIETSYRQQNMPQMRDILDMQVTILSAAKASLTPVHSARYQIIVIGFILAIIISLCVALLFNFFDHNIKTSRDIRKYFDGIPVLFTIENVDEG